MGWCAEATMVTLLFSFAAQVDLSADKALDVRVSVRVPATSAKSAIGALAKASGAKVAASGTIAADVLTLRVTDVPIREVMTRLSSAAGATWVQENGVYYLTRTDSDRAKWARASQQRLALAFKKEFAKQGAAITSSTPFDSAAAKALIAKVVSARHPAAVDGGPAQSFVDFGALYRAAPAGRLASRILPLLDAERLSAAPVRRRTIFSTNPTRMELPLNVSADSAVSAFLEEQQVYQAALAGLPDGERIGIEMGPDGNTANALKERPAKLNVVVNRLDAAPDSSSVEVQLVGEHGTKLASSSVQIHSDPDFPDQKALLPAPNEKRLTLPDDVTSVLQVLGANLSGKAAKTTQLSPELRQWLSQPDVNEPLSIFASSLLLAAADDRGLNLVADLPDAYIILGASPSFLGVPASSSILKLVSALPPSIAPVSVDEKWIEIDGGKAVPEDILCHRSDRRAMAQAIAGAAEGVIPIERLAAYAVTGGGVPDDFLFMAMNGVLFGSDIQESSDEWHALHIIGSLLEHRPADRIRSARIPFSELDAPTLDVVQTIVFYQQPRSLLAPRPGMVMNEVEPCEALPGGLPRDGFLEIDVKESSAVYTSGPRRQLVNAQTLAWNDTLKEHPDRFPGAESRYSSSDQFRVGTNRVVTVTIHLTESMTAVLPVTEAHVQQGSLVRFDDLPKEFKDSYRRIKASYADMK